MFPISVQFGRLLICFCLTCLLLSAKAQTPAANETPEKKKDVSYWKPSFSFLSNSVYYGRHDSLATPYLTPGLGYYSKDGWYISGSLAFLVQKKATRVDYGAIDVGYQFAFTDKFSGELYAEKTWYNSSSTNIKNDINGTAGSSLSYDLGVINLNGGVDLTFATKTDIGLNLGLSHSFEFGESDHSFSLEPNVLANWSTLHSYEGFITKKVNRQLPISVPANSKSSVSTQVQNNRMTLLDYEFSLPLSYSGKSFGFAFTPTLAVPLNPIHTTTVVTTSSPGNGQSTQSFDSTPQSEKNLMANFYAELSVYLKF